MAGFAGTQSGTGCVVIRHRLFLVRTNLIMDKMHHCSCGSAGKSKLCYFILSTAKFSSISLPKIHAARAGGRAANGNGPRLERLPVTCIPGHRRESTNARSTCMTDCLNRSTLSIQSNGLLAFV